MDVAWLASHCCRLAIRSGDQSIFSAAIRFVASNSLFFNLEQDVAHHLPVAGGCRADLLLGERCSKLLIGPIDRPASRGLNFRTNRS